MENSLNTQEVSDLCKGCGMCCDGTLFKTAKIFKGEDVPLAKALNLEIILVDGIEKLKLPCPCFNTFCTVYDKPKPTVCSHFFCEPLKKYEKGVLNFIEAKMQVLNTFTLRNEIISESQKTEELKTLNWSDLILFLDNLFVKNDLSEINKYGQLVLKFILFNNSLKLMYKAKTENTTN